MTADPILRVLLFSSVAAATAALGALPLVGRRRLPKRWMGTANAIASGMMLGAAFMLTEARLPGSPASTAVGAAAGILFIYGTHRLAGTAGVVLDRPHPKDPAYGYKFLLLGTLHGASEGVAIGVAMLLDLDFGVFMALAIAVHNVPEATVLASVLRGRGVGAGEAAGLAVLANVGQVLMAVAVCAVGTALPAALPWTLGFAVGALIHLVLVELLPESYRQAGVTMIAVVTVTAMGAVVLAEQILP